MMALSRFGSAITVPVRDGRVRSGKSRVLPRKQAGQAIRKDRGRRRFVSLNRSPLARKIIVFNLLALVILVSGVLFLNPFRNSLVLQREAGLITEARLMAKVFEATLPGAGADTASAPPGPGIEATLARLDLPPGIEVFVFDVSGRLLAKAMGAAAPNPDPALDTRSTLFGDFLNMVWDGATGLLTLGRQRPPNVDAEGLARAIFAEALTGSTGVDTGRDPTTGAAMFSVATPIRNGNTVTGVVAVTSAAGEIDRLVRAERQQVLQMFIIALLVSVGLSLVLASTIATPLSALAAAAELGRNRDARKMAPGRVRIPDLAARSDEIGRLSVAMRGMVAALYDRIDANEQFAADVAHEIKNPLASLRSAVGTIRFAREEDQRQKLLEVIEHDVDRLDRLVSDISNASRLDSELVKEEETSFNLCKTLAGLSAHLGARAAEKGVDFITDLPPLPIMTRGLEERLAQVFVNLITNAISFCEAGDAVRIWAHRRENRVLVVVEDTGPGIAEQALGKIFNRFYSERPAGQFGNHSGLGLAISKQIVEAHGGVIWAENIQSPRGDGTSGPAGARFVVGLPV
ncbi:MAG: sensor histidine kinase [Rhodobacter sp.]|nr:sensor histidine kinase [Rhodobacter sp.]